MRQLSQQEIKDGANFAMNALLNVPQADVRAWELATNVPELQNLWAYVCLALNVLIPGTGTMICACLGDENMNKTQLFIGFFQFLTSIYLVGWIFSIYWGVLIVQKSSGNHEQLKGLIGKGQQTSEQVQQIQKANAKLNPYEDKR